ncbi:hypothetical protein D4764_13G0007860 [Takifugu flavidus]|uniref:Uncharacterized protein n=1 Tax=Takifugu flavidus TaxID=433684 RepID=A0A5C6P8I7_9TELE|nr:hypothetical protein D4764_13G0007860 [Takifugu flavidus]
MATVMSAARHVTDATVSLPPSIHSVQYQCSPDDGGILIKLATPITTVGQFFSEF